jgi:hypothetical protein
MAQVVDTEQSIENLLLLPFADSKEGKKKVLDEISV